MSGVAGPSGSVSASLCRARGRDGAGTGAGDAELRERCSPTSRLFVVSGNRYNRELGGFWGISTNFEVIRDPGFEKKTAKCGRTEPRLRRTVCAPNRGRAAQWARRPIRTAYMAGRLGEIMVAQRLVGKLIECGRHMCGRHMRRWRPSARMGGRADGARGRDARTCG